MKTNILVLSLSDQMGGAEQCLRLIAAQTNAQMLFLLSAKSSKLSEIDLGKAQYLSKRSLLMGFIRLPFALYRYRNFTLVSSHAYLNGVIGIMGRVGYLKGLLIVRESTSIFERYNGLKKRLYLLLYRLGYPALDRVICQSNAMASQLLANAPYLGENVVRVVPNPLNLDNALKMAAVESSPVVGQYICAAGRLIAIKGFDLLIKAFSRLLVQHPDLRLVILGAGPLHAKLNLLIKELGIDKNVMLIGYQENPYPYFKSARVCVIPSIMEGFPNVLLQMMAVNDSVVSTRCAGGIEDIPGIIKVNPGSVNELYAGLQEAMLNKNPERSAMDAFLAERNPGAFIHNVFSGLPSK